MLSAAGRTVKTGSAYASSSRASLDFHATLRRMHSVHDATAKSEPNTATAGSRFLTSSDMLLQVLRRKQVTYRLKGINPRRKQLLADSKDLALSEIRWIVEHVRARARDSSTTQDFSRDQRRSLIYMATQMTRKDMPVSYLLGTMPFGSLPKPLIVRQPVLLPRPETEHWATQAAKAILVRLRKTNQSTRTLRIADLCTGSGCVALLVAHILRTKYGESGWTIVACDVSADAVALATENRDQLGFSQEQVQIIQADIFDDTDMQKLCTETGAPFDIILSNPPYIPRRDWKNLSASVKLHEDAIALIGERDAAKYSEHLASSRTESQEGHRSDRDGLAFLRRLADLAFSPWFSTLTKSPSSAASGEKHTPPHLLVAEYGKGQHKLVHDTFASEVPPAQRLPTIVKIPERLYICGLGNAMTHPLTRHSIGQVVLEPLLKEFGSLDRLERRRLTDEIARLQSVQNASQQDKSFTASKKLAWSSPIPTSLPAIFATSSTSNFAIPDRFVPSKDFRELLPSRGSKEAYTHPKQLTKAVGAREGGWTATIPILIPSQTDSSIVYQVDVVLYKPSVAMNLSGLGLKAFLQTETQNKKAISATSNILILHDEMDLDFGEVNRRNVGSARGHNGMRDVLDKFGMNKPNNQKIARLRIGVGRPTGNKKNVSTASWVLMPLSREETFSLSQNTRGSVLESVLTLTSKWIRDRVKAIVPTDEVLRNQPGLDRQVSIVTKEDQFGVNRTIWVEPWYNRDAVPRDKIQ